MDQLRQFRSRLQALHRPGWRNFWLSVLYFAFLFLVVALILYAAGTAAHLSFFFGPFGPYLRWAISTGALTSLFVTIFFRRYFESPGDGLQRAGTAQFRQRARATAAWTPTYPDPLVITEGERVAVGNHDTEWPAFVWCTTADGKGGWVPDSYLDIDGSQAVARRDYSAAELAVAVGDEVTVRDEVGGWFWCEDARGHCGWVPAENLQLLD